MSTAAGEIEISLNGEAFRVAEGTTIAGLVRQLGLPEDRVAVEVDRSVVRRAQWREAALAPGARVEIVQIVGGG